MTEKKSFITEKIKNIPYSGIRRFFDVANEIEGAISLGVGEPDFGRFVRGLYILSKNAEQFIRQTPDFPNYEKRYQNTLKIK